MSDVTRILNRIEAGDHRASEELLPLVYGELRRLAQARMTAERPDHTLQPTALVHEAYVRLVQSDDEAAWDSRGHFFAAAAEAMRRILIDRARKRNRGKHGGGMRRVSLDSVDLAANSDDATLLAIDESLERLSEESPAKAQLVKLRFFSGLTVVEAAVALGISPATAKRYWAYARAWLLCDLEGEPGN